MVCGKKENDHLGHGKSVRSDEYLGFFASKNGSNAVVQDIEHLRNIMQKEYGDIPYYILGHSMGSFLLRKCLSKYSNGLSGAIIMGTGNQSDLSCIMGKCLCKLISLFHGWHYRSELVNKLVMSGHNKRFKEEHQEKMIRLVDMALV